MQPLTTILKRATLFACAPAMCVLLGKAQSINIDCEGGFGDGVGPPAAGFSAAAPASAADAWNTVAAGGTVSNVALVDTSGVSIAAKASHTASNAYSENNVNTTGNDDKLLDDFEDLQYPNTTWTIGPLLAGTYDVYSYAWAPDYRTSGKTKVEVVGAQQGPIIVGGSNFPGSTTTYEMPGHYALHTIAVPAGGSISISFSMYALVGTMNGLQLRFTPETMQALDCQIAPSATQGCDSIASATGSPSATAAIPFVVTFGSLNTNVNGVAFYGVTGPTSLPWSPESLLCVNTPLRRLNGVSGAFGDTDGTLGNCDGAYSFDMNAVLQAAGVGAGTSVGVQTWVRDPLSTKTTILTDALLFTLGP